MTDLVERLRALVIMDEARSDNPLGREAADEIERLLKENRNMNKTIASDAIMIFERDQEIERLRAALDRLTTQRRQDIGQLRAENERLQAALSKAIDELSYTDLRASGGIAEAP